MCATLDLPVLALEWIGHLGGQPFQTAPYLALEAVDIGRQRGVGITSQIKQSQLAEAFGVEVHGGDPHAILAVPNDPLFETGGQGPRPPEEEVDCRDTAYVEDGWRTGTCRRTRDILLRSTCLPIDGARPFGYNRTRAERERQRHIE